MQKIIKFLRISSKIFIVLLILGFTGLTGLYLFLEPKLPSIDGLNDIQLQVPLRVYSSEGGLMAEYGEKRRSPKAIDEIPLALRQAFLAAEDDRFYEHPGVDYQGILRAVMVLLTTGERGQGGSTITMQLARNFYLSREKTFGRKLNEIFLALKIEQQLSKDQILELYLNKIYLGNRAYGVAAAARVYYGKDLDDLDLSQLAMIAGLPKAPSRYNPVINPDRAVLRRNYVLKRMLILGYISEADMRFAKAQSVTAGLHMSQVDVPASYVAEMVRAEITRQFGEEAYTRGLNVFTTIDGRLQKAANASLRHALQAYDRRHGYRGPESHIDLKPEGVEYSVGELEVLWEDAVEDLSNIGGMRPALVIETLDQGARVYLKGGRLIQLDWESIKWAKPFVNRNRQGKEPEKAADILKPGDIVRVYKEADKWLLGQVPEIQGALTSLRSNDGALQALVGGYDFHQSKFNRALQAKRQAGSSFKPFIYSAALSKGYTAATLINDAPVVFHDPALEGTWRPENYSGKFFGPTRLREALVKSRNLVSIRILRAIGVRYATSFAKNYGFNDLRLPHDLSLALGSGELSPLQLSTGFSVFSNGGYRIKPYFIQRIEDLKGNVLFEAEPEVACVSCELKARGIVLPQVAGMDGLKAEQLRQEQLLSQSLQKQTEQKEVNEQKKTTLMDGADDARPIDVQGSGDADKLADSQEANLGYKLPRQAERTVDERVIYIMNTILKDVINRGTGRRARVLGRNDLHGKTGTTNDQKDAWFNGFNNKLVTTAWVGFDQQQLSLGNYETGSKAALPMWIEFMKTALKGVPETQMPRPEGLVNVRINAQTGKLANASDTDVVFEVFRSELSPKSMSAQKIPTNLDSRNVIPEQLF
ncbi:Multimodular transpeptidase-transglycosylase [hydrothermal vent metagenome]|uniref:Penicillin-binding protein 1A n=1 Tax=hydrothermal vent metagenome TaxID=652676 RepID=A0A3B0X2T2_9ZZZZ